MRSRSNSGRTGREADRSQTVDQKRDRSRRTNRLFVLGIGPGSLEHLTKRAVEVLASVDVVAGYRKYIEFIRPLIEGKEIISTGMTKEVQRVEAAIDRALSGRLCAIVSSGDPGIYAMAGLVFEVCKLRGIPVISQELQVNSPNPARALEIVVVPGIPALCAGAALLGAPLTHDFAVISLSDLLTPWEKIEERLEAAAKADFVIVIYNPKSKKRSWQLEKAQQIILKYRDKNTPVGIVTRAMREEQDVTILPLAKLHEAYVHMQTTVFVGSSASRRHMDFMFTPRGYSKKYNIEGNG